MPLAVKNKNRLIQYMSGFQGFATGANALLNLPVNRRYHRLSFMLTAAAGVVEADAIIDSIKLIVNGVAIRDITPTNIIKMAIANGYEPALGELPIFFTDPLALGGVWNEPPDVCSWDMFGQSTFEIQIAVKSGLTTPAITGLMEFDFERNQLPDGTLLLQPIAMHQFSMPLVVGQNDIVTLPFSFPIRRMWFQGSNAGNITSLELIQDGNKVLEGTPALIRHMYRQSGFQLGLGKVTWIDDASLAAQAYFEAAFIADIDARWWRSLACANSLMLRIVSGAAQTLTTVMETMPGAFR